MGMQIRLVPLAAWYWTFVRTGAPPALSAHALGSIRWAVGSYAMWTASVPALAVGFAADAPWLLAAGAWAGCAATLVTGFQGWLVVRHAFDTPRWLSWCGDVLRRRSHSHQLAVPQGRS